jgi:hypothetical protein
MRVFAVGIEHPLDLAVQRPQHSDPRMHEEVAAFGCTDQAMNSGLPFRKVLLCFGSVMM